jgi:protocatechuate 3,4-dioxygenase beta subunit
MKMPITIGAVTAIAVAVFVALYIGQSDPPPYTFKCTPTENNIEGPYYKAGAPAWLAPNVPGEKLTVSGKAVDQNCNPVPGAVLDFWQADSAGAYDSEGYRLRGEITAGQDGRYQLDTIVPGKYEPRPRHIHAKVWVNDSELLTTQLYIVRNDRDQYVKDSLILQTKEQGGAMAASFDFVVIR